MTTLSAWERSEATKHLDEGWKPLAIAEILLFARHILKRDGKKFAEYRQTDEYKQELMDIYKAIGMMDKHNYAPRPDRPDSWD